MPHPRIRRNPPPPDPITTATIQQLWRDAKWQYQLCAHATERLDEEIRFILTGRRTNMKKYHHLEQKRQEHLSLLHPILTEIAARAEAHGRRPTHDTDTQLGYLTTIAQSIAAAGAKQKLEITFTK